MTDTKDTDILDKQIDTWIEERKYETSASSHPHIPPCGIAYYDHLIGLSEADYYLSSGCPRQPQ